jgi:hypothetical protein
MTPTQVRAVLRAEAAAHQPDRAAILARIERGQATAHPTLAARTGRPRAAVRMAGIGMTVLAVLGLSVAVTWAAVGTDVLRKSSHGPMIAPAPANGTPEAVQSPVTAGRPQSAPHSPRSPAASPTAKGAEQSFVRSSGAINTHSNDNWTQADLTVVTSDTVTALDVTVRIARTPNLASTGAWSTILAEFLVTGTEQQPDAVVYHFTLKPGVTLSPATYVFAVQYNHATGRDPSHDTYHLTASTKVTRAELNGTF